MGWITGKVHYTIRSRWTSNKTRFTHIPRRGKGAARYTPGGYAHPDAF